MSTSSRSLSAGGSGDYGLWCNASAAFEWQTTLPLFRRVQQRFPRPRVEDLPAAVAQAMDASEGSTRLGGGRRVAITAGSRGINHVPEILAAVVARVRHYGGVPFLVPAMGSHGRATVEGQLSLLADLGITEEAVGAPIEASMEVVKLGELPEGMPVYMDRIAAAADAIVVVNRVKPHTDYSGDIESGLAKMIAIGLGKERGADTIHRYGTHGLRDLLPRAAQLAVQKAPIAVGLAILENAYDEVASIVPVAPFAIGGPEEAKLLAQARTMMARLPFDEIDVLIVDQMGKNISGPGMDPSILGRMRVHGLPDRTPPAIRVVAVLDLTGESHGNAAGIGLADVTTRRLVEQIDFHAAYLNCMIASIGGIQRGMLPLVTPDDRAAVMTALRVCGRHDPENARMVRIKNTLRLGEIDVSEILWAEVGRLESLSPASEPFALPFDEGGRLRSFEETAQAIGGWR